MGKTASLVLKIVGWSLALAAAVCLVLGGWSELTACFKKVKGRACKSEEYKDYDDEALYAE